MSFEIICPGCGQSLLADEGMLGRRVKCPACQHQVAVEAPPPQEPGTDKPDDGEFRLSDELELPERERPADMAENVEGNDDAAGEDKSETGPTECPACGVMIAEGEFECRSCRFNLQVGRRVEDFSGGEHYAGTVGFERYFLKRMHHAENLTKLFAWFHVAFAFLLGLVCFVFRAWWPYLPISLITLYVAYHLLAYLNGYFYRGKSFFWSLFLRWGRLLRWRRLSGFKQRNYWTNHDASFDDTLLADRQDLGGCHVIDVQGTGITDDGLKSFEYLPILEFLVLKNTNVTASGVGRLQATIPDTCIWY